MQRIINKILLMAFVIYFLCFIFSFKMYARDIDTIMNGADSFLEDGNKAVLNMSQIKKTTDLLFTIFSGIGTCVVLVIGAIIGIQFIMGSIEEKAKIKEFLLPYVVGSIVIFGAVGIWLTTTNIFENIFKS